MAYKNILNPKKCSGCCSRDFCFLRKISLQDYPESTQNFIVHIPSSLFYFNETEYRWYTNYQAILNHIIACYNGQRNIIQENLRPDLSIDEQRDSDRQFIREKFKQLLDVAAKATEKSAPEVSIVFDGIGLVLASDYLEAVHKVLSMFQKYTDIVNPTGNDCGYFSANPNY